MDEVALEHGRLFVGDLVDGRSAPESIDVIVNVSQQGYNDSRMVHLPLRDSGSADYNQFREAVKRIVYKLYQGKTVLVHCAVGCNRGPSVAAGALAVMGKDDPLQLVLDARSVANPLPVYREFVQRVKDDTHLDSVVRDRPGFLVRVVACVKRYLWLRVKRPFVVWRGD